MTDPAQPHPGRPDTARPRRSRPDRRRLPGHPRPDGAEGAPPRSVTPGAARPGTGPADGASRRPHPATESPPFPLLSLRGATFAYEDGPVVLDGLDFDVREGRALALLGRNGSGKTTLMRLLSGGLRPLTGELTVEGRPVRYDRAGLTRLRTTVQLVVQDPDDQLFAASVAQDVSFGPLNLGLPGAEVRARVAEALDALDIAPLADRPTHLLSYGQRKRAAIAGAVAMRPRVLILDEPTAGLDPDGQERLLAILDRLRAGGTTVVLATHDVDLALRWADDAALLTPSGAHTGPAAVTLARADLLRQAGLRLPWGVAAGRLLRRVGLLGDGEPGPRTPEELASALRTAPPDGTATPPAVSPGARGTRAPATGALETAPPKTAAPRTAARDTETPETACPETAAGGTETPETANPRTQAPEARAPGTTAPGDTCL
jgi:cobalt/nickel transport system ATP-binding protein